MRPLDVAVLHGATLGRPDEIDTVRTAEAVDAALRRLGHRSRIVNVGGDLAALAAVADERPDLVFNLVEALEGDVARAARVPAALDRLGLRYTGCGAAATERCVSKPAMKRAMATAGLPTPAWSEDGGRGGELADVPLVIVKSATEHASLGLDAGSIVPGRDAAAAIAARAEIAVRTGMATRGKAATRSDTGGAVGSVHGGAFFAETFIDGRELNLSLLETPAGPLVLPPAEIVFDAFPPGRPRIVDYEAKWVEGSFAYRNTPRRFDFPPGDAPLLAALADLAVRAWNLFGLAGYARVDFRVDGDGRPFLLEVNTNPCLAPDAGLAAAAQRAGLGYDRLIAAIVATAAARAPALKPGGRSALGPPSKAPMPAPPAGAVGK